jgi:uncharacterized protein
MANRTLSEWEPQWASLVKRQSVDAAHDFDHVERVVSAAKEIAAAEGGRLEVVVPAAWLHDLVSLPKNHPERHLASQKSASAGCELLQKAEYPSHLLPEIAHCIEAHSFSARIEPRTLEACIVQDADRLDALGAIGIARCFATAGALNRALYDRADPFAEHRQLDDQLYTLDHFEIKLFKIAETLRTASGRRLGRKRAEYMREFLRHLKTEIAGVGGVN